MIFNWFKRLVGDDDLIDYTDPGKRIEPPVTRAGAKATPHSPTLPHLPVNASPDYFDFGGKDSVDPVEPEEEDDSEGESKKNLWDLRREFDATPSLHEFRMKQIRIRVKELQDQYASVQRVSGLAPLRIHEDVNYLIRTINRMMRDADSR